MTEPSSVGTRKSVSTAPTAQPLRDWSLELWKQERGGPFGIRTAIIDDRWFIMEMDAKRFSLPRGTDPTTDWLPGEV
jgi:hypothetical protein